MQQVEMDEQNHYAENLDQLSSVKWDVISEMIRQDRKWGANRHHNDAPADPDGSRLRNAELLESITKERLDEAFKNGDGSWLHILLEEVAEVETAAFSRDREHLREELVQVAALIFQWVKDLDTFAR